MKLTNNKITHENVIQNRMFKTQITDQQITNAYIEDDTIKTNVQIVANTYKNISFNTLDSLLFSLNKRLNDKTFRYHEKYPEKKIGFHAYHERVNNNAHSNIILKVPPEYDVLNIVLDMEKLWTKLDKRKNPKFKLYYDLDVRDQSKCTNYSRKNSHYVPI